MAFSVYSILITRDDVVSQRHKFGCAFFSYFFIFYFIFFFPCFFNFPVSRAVPKNCAIFIGCNFQSRASQVVIGCDFSWKKKNSKDSAWLVYKIISLIFNNWLTAQWFINLGDQLVGPDTPAKMFGRPKGFLKFPLEHSLASLKLLQVRHITSYCWMWKCIFWGH